MAKKTKKRVEKQAPVEQKPDMKALLNREAGAIIVLALSAVAFIIALVTIHSEDFLHGAGDLFSVYNGELVEYETAIVDEVLSQELRADEVISDAPVGSQELSVTVTSGRYKGEQMVVHNYFGALSGVPVKVGDGVTLTIKSHSDGSHSATVFELNRTPLLVVYFLLFSVAVVVVGRLTGFKSLLGLIFTGICIFTILIPLIIKGAPAIGATFIVCAYISLVCFTILGGVHRKSICAFLGTVAGTFFAMVCGVTVQWLARIDGLRFDDAEASYQLGLYEGILLDIRGLLVAGIIVCSLGAVMDVAMSISSSIEEIHAANPALNQKELFKSGMNVGRDMAGTMTNTLILAIIGGQFALMVFFYARGFTLNHLLSLGFIAIETISGLSSSLGMILAIPLTALISSVLIARKAGER